MSYNIQKQELKFQSRTYNEGLCLLKFIAAFGIVGCHLNMRPTTFAGEWLLHFTDTNVGLFGIISGYFFTQSIYKTTELIVFLKKRTLRLLPAYFFWSICYLFLKFGLDIFTRGKISPSFNDPMCWYYIIFWGGSAAHLWYVISLYYITILLFFQRKFLHAIWLFMMIIAFFWTMKGWGGFYSWYPIRLLAFFSLGVGIYYLDNSLTSIKQSFWSLLLIIALIIHLYSPMRGLICVYDALVCIPFFMIFRNLHFNANNHSIFFLKLGNFSFGIYLTHVFIAFAIGSLIRLYSNAPYSGWVLFLVWVLVFVIAMLITFLFRLSPITRRFVE